MQKKFILLVLVIFAFALCFARVGAQPSGRAAAGAGSSGSDDSSSSESDESEDCDEAESASGAVSASDGGAAIPLPVKRQAPPAAPSAGATMARQGKPPKKKRSSAPPRYADTNGVYKKWIDDSNLQAEFHVKDWLELVESLEAGGKDRLECTMCREFFNQKRASGQHVEVVGSRKDKFGLGGSTRFQSKTWKDHFKSEKHQRTIKFFKTPAERLELKVNSVLGKSLATQEEVNLSEMRVHFKALVWIVRRKVHGAVCLLFVHSTNSSLQRRQLMSFK